MELLIFARFHAREGQEEAVAAAIREVVPPTRAEPGCGAIAAYRSTHDPRLHCIHSRWVDEAAFETHAGLSHAVRFIERVQSLIDCPLEVSRGAREGFTLVDTLAGRPVPSFPSKKKVQAPRCRRDFNSLGTKGAGSAW
jgi:quinol monooxygenase YgiN